MINTTKWFRVPFLALIFALAFSFIAPTVLPLAPDAEARTEEEINIDLADARDTLQRYEADRATETDPANQIMLDRYIANGVTRIDQLQSELVAAQGAPDPTKALPTATGTSSRGSATLSLTNPLGGARDINVIIGRIAKAMITLAGALALLAFIWGGFQMMTSRGIAAQYEKGKQTLIWATVGLVLIFTAYTLVNTVITVLTSGTV